jgi:hypothetical protein
VTVAPADLSATVPPELAETDDLGKTGTTTASDAGSVAEAIHRSSTQPAPTNENASGSTPGRLKAEGRYGLTRGISQFSRRRPACS